MEGNTSRILPQTPEERLGDTPEIAESFSAHQRRHRQRGHVTRPDEPQKDVQQPHISARVSKRQFHETVLLLHHDVDAQNDYLPQRLENELQRRTEARYSGPLPHHPQEPGDNSKTPSQMSTDTVAPESTEPGPISTGFSQEVERQSYVAKRREEQQVHTKVHPGAVGTRIQRKDSRGRHSVNNTLFPGRGLPDLRRILARRRQRKAALGTTISQFGLHDEQSLAAPVNWPFGCKATSGLYRDSGRVQHHPLTQRETRLLLRNPLIRDGNMGPLPAPAGVTAPQPPPHVYGTNPGTRKTGRVSCLQVPRLPGLRRRNAQRRSPNPALQESFKSFNDRFNARFRRGTAVRDVHVKYAAPVELVRRRSMLAQIQEASNESSDSEPTQREETGARQKDESHQHAAPSTGEQDKSLERKPQHQSGGNKIPMAELYKTPGLRRFSLVIRGPRPAPAYPSTSSSEPTAPPSSASLTIARASTPPSEIELQAKSEPESLTQNGSGCGTPGCTWANCSHIRGPLRMPFLGTPGESKSEVGGGSTAETTSEGDNVSLGNGFSFLRLN